MRPISLAILLAALPAVSLAQPTAAAPPAAEADADASEWPRAAEIGNGQLELYQPQLERFEGTALSGRSAVAYSEKDKAPVFGVVWFTAHADVDRDTRTASVRSVKVDKVRFPNIQKDQEQKIARVIEAAVPTWDLTIGLETIQASLAVAQRERTSSEGLKSTPPKMILVNEPAVLLLYEGRPVEQPAGDGNLKRVVNTPMFVILDPSTHRYYLSGGKFWYEAAAATGPFAPVAAPSPAVKQFFDAHPPPAPKDEGDAAAKEGGKRYEDPSTPPRIVVSTEPSELIVFDGPPKFQPVGDEADLLYAENTQSNVFVYVPTGDTYVVVTGRWFRSKSMDGPWTAVRPDKLPAAFAKLPPDSAVGEVRTFVSGTEEAQNALADTQIPQTTAVKRDQTLEVVYDGEPRFKQIEGTPLAFAVNTPMSVVADAGSYWACHQGVWYVAPTPKGPWAVSDKRPPDIDQVPPSAPVYNTKYVYVYQSTPQVVYTGYLPGYVGMYPYYGTVVYGTGFLYPPYIGPTVYYPRPVTFGFGVVYNPWVGFGFGMTWGTPFYSVGFGFGYPGYPPFYRPPWYGPVGYRPYPPPYPGGWYRPPPGYRPPYPGYRPPPPGWGRPPGYGGGYGPGGRPAPPRPANGNNIYARPENRARNADRQQAIATRPAPKPVNRPNNVYGDRQGNVYRQSGDSWEKNTPQGWKPQPATSSARPGTASASPSTRPAPSPSARPTTPPSTRPGAAGPTPSTRPAAPPTASRPSSYPSARPSYPSAPAGLSRDAAARQRASAPSMRGSGGSAPRGGGGGGGAPRGGGGGRGH
jgi:hypothetical protein